ncbi:hypothetical protein WJX73_000254 [Symbiochloris irregularis]|uniref:Uncharacterized protein n=1 Tax=Symbiochloris irregularis TaxID=706552 RepID=A0AAW1PCH0_9CHLO
MLRLSAAASRRRLFSELLQPQAPSQLTNAVNQTGAFDKFAASRLQARADAGQSGFVPPTANESGALHTATPSTTRSDKRSPCLPATFATSVRCLSDSAAHANDLRRSNEGTEPQFAPPQPAGNILVYEGPLSTTLRRLKKLSIFSCGFTLLGSPLIVQMGSAHSSLGGKVAIASMLCGFGIFTTGLLHWFVGPYVHHLNYRKGSKTVEVDTLNLLARPIHETLRLDDIRPPNTLRPQATFQAHGKIYYVDTDKIEDKKALQELSQHWQTEEEHAQSANEQRSNAERL